MPERSPNSGLAGGLFGILVFLAGVALLLFAFKLAYDMFHVDPSQLFSLKPGKPIDFSEVLPKLLGVVIRVLLLLVMAAVGGMIANRGIRLYADGRSRTAKAE